MNTNRLLAGLASLALLASIAGCVDPGQGDWDLQQYQQQLIDHAEKQALADQFTKLGAQNPMRPDGTWSGAKLKMTKDSETGRTAIELSLQEAVQRALANNLEIRVVGFDPEISRQEMMAAAAVFDYVIFGGITYSHDDIRANSSTAGAKFTREKTTTVEAGIKKHLQTGADVSLTYELARSWTNSPFVSDSTSYEPSLTLELIQPLLRGAGLGVNRATLHIARINHRIGQQQFRQQVEQVLVNVVSSYWQLLQARTELDIQKSLLKSTQETFERVEKRIKLDATAVVLQQTKAAVATRNAALIRAEKVVRDVEDQMARLLVDGQINILADMDIVPVTTPVTKPWNLSSTDQLATALRHSPVLAQARLAVESAGVSYKVSRNALLPQLNLTGSSTLQGQDRHKSISHDQVTDRQYQSYSVGLTFEYPLYNRGAKAGARRARMEQLKATTNLRNLAVQVGQQVKERIREIETTYGEMLAQQKAVEAAELQLKALDDTERIRARLTPEFLQLKLQAQETLAAARRAELQALVSYNTAKVSLSAATGTILSEYSIDLAQSASGK